MNSLADLYKDPFADLNKAPQPTPDVPVEEGMSPAEMAGWGAAALGGGLIGRAALKKANNNVIQPGKNIVAELSDRSGLSNLIDKGEEQVTRVFNNVSDGAKNLNQAGSVLTAPYIDYLNKNFDNVVAQIKPFALTRNDTFGRLPVNVDHKLLRSVMHDVRTAAETGAGREGIFNNLNRLSAHDNQVFDTYFKSRKGNKLSADAQGIIKFLGNSIKQNLHRDHTINMFTDPSEIEKFVETFGPFLNAGNV